MARILLICLVILSCKRSSGPSPDYISAKYDYQSLMTRSGDDAYLEEEMRGVEKQLRRVKANSDDKVAADELLTTIAQGRERMKEVLKEKEKGREALNQPLPDDLFAPMQTSETTGAASKDSSQAQAQEKKKKANAAPGAIIADVARDSDGCLIDGETIELGGIPTRSMVLRDLYRCRSANPQLEKKVVLHRDGKVVEVVDESTLRTRYVEVPAPKAGGANSGSQDAKK